MGNCVARQANIVKVMKTDGKVLEYKSPIKAQQVLTDFAGHALSEACPVIRHLQPETRLLGGRIYYLVPLQRPSPPKATKKKVRFSLPEVESDQNKDISTTGVLRIKVVIRKQELQDMLQNNEGHISINEMISRFRNESDVGKEDIVIKSTDVCYEGWKPALESIPEVI